MANSAIYLPIHITIHTVTSHAFQLFCVMGPLEIFVVLETGQVTDIGYFYSYESDLWKESPPEYVMLVALNGRKAAHISEFECAFQKEILKMKGQIR